MQGISATMTSCTRQSMPNKLHQKMHSLMFNQLLCPKLWTHSTTQAGRLSHMQCSIHKSTAANGVVLSLHSSATAASIDCQGLTWLLAEQVAYSAQLIAGVHFPHTKGAVHKEAADPGAQVGLGEAACQVVQVAARWGSKVHAPHCALPSAYTCHPPPAPHGQAS